MRKVDKKKKKSREGFIFKILGIILLALGLSLAFVGFKGIDIELHSMFTGIAETLHVKGEPNSIVGISGVVIAILGLVFCVIGWKKSRD